ncbi:MAG: hypothetical protein CO189_04000 [candidate division Zixibacteria bacterium CG_4_9_14_3_um_filter_46_8]|nr:MAG: hypothetical protein CO189_04000 [candidate division Zixibacteria bacterium CG_4_9_14_3_um_filter_46_8]
MEDRLIEHIRIEMLNSMRCIKIADDILKTLLEMTPLSKNERYNFRVAVSEVVSNSYLHGNCQDPKKKITFECKISVNEIQVRVEDEGEGFTNEEITEKYESEGLYATGGRGLKIVNKIADNIICHQTSEGNFAVTICKHFKLQHREQTGVV